LDRRQLAPEPPVSLFERRRDVDGLWLVVAGPLAWTPSVLSVRPLGLTRHRDRSRSPRPRAARSRPARRRPVVVAVDVGADLLAGLVGVAVAAAAMRDPVLCQPGAEGAAGQLRVDVAAQRSFIATEPSLPSRATRTRVAKNGGRLPCPPDEQPHRLLHPLTPVLCHGALADSAWVSRPGDDIVVMSGPQRREACGSLGAGGVAATRAARLYARILARATRLPVRS
jgi:hypothetical protein